MDIPKGHDIELVGFKQDVLEKDFHIPAKAINSYYLTVRYIPNNNNLSLIIMMFSQPTTKQ